ncbi:hypothetical protein J4Q44_G00018660 [Coregonus suidteri]|uniref:Uncharacterized protein n=1 Tax=Coregonus suidteri TaxID=861788 RepID=A0AAN8NF79_9TELE
MEDPFQSNAFTPDSTQGNSLLAGQITLVIDHSTNPPVVTAHFQQPPNHPNLPHHHLHHHHQPIPSHPQTHQHAIYGTLLSTKGQPPQPPPVPQIWAVCPPPGYIYVAAPAPAPATNITMAPIDTTLNTGNPAVPLEEAKGSPATEATKNKQEEAEQGRGETTKKMAIFGEVGDSSDGMNSEKIEGEKRDGESVEESNPSPVKEVVQCARRDAADGGGDRTGSDISSSRKQKGSVKGAKLEAGPTPKAPRPPQPPRSRLGHQMMQSVQVFHKLGVKAQTSNQSNQSIPNEQMTEEKVILMDQDLLDFETIHVTVANCNSSVVEKRIRDDVDTIGASQAEHPSSAKPTVFDNPITLDNLSQKSASSTTKFVSPSCQSRQPTSLGGTIHRDPTHSQPFAPPTTHNHTLFKAPNPHLRRRYRGFRHQFPSLPNTYHHPTPPGQHGRLPPPDSLYFPNPWQASVPISLWQREEREDMKRKTQQQRERVSRVTKQGWDHNVFINREQYTLENYLSSPTVPILKGTMSAWKKLMEIWNK